MGVVLLDRLYHVCYAFVNTQQLTAILNKNGKFFHHSLLQAESTGIAEVQLQMASDLAEGEGQIAILSATSTEPNQPVASGVEVALHLSPLTLYS